MTNQEKNDLPIGESVRDYIFSRTLDRRVAEVEYLKRSQQVDNYFYGKIVKSNMPPRLAWLIQEYDELVKNVVISLLDEVEEEIYTYDLQLESSGERVSGISLIEDDISFFSGPSVHDEYPNYDSENKGAG
ncbi:hypothetical protein [Saccharibacillus endophyticus]|uniref:Uncharacterized protein n=1 Tax=Saccharibacillus endophyticus TaxID=2060666 RepID=A0ABQ1ZLS6_9BACL|nr:hypothetical protein [Saccharibacillus endophyticus]GGH68444.1 hypothetical protein GCM10007362_02460 [Saccharibacillus endophyticus]